jgi:hypothetical protein
MGDDEMKKPSCVKQSSFTQFWGIGVGSRQLHPVNFLEVGKKDASASCEVRRVMSERFEHVGEAFVFFDLDHQGSLTRVRFERGLARMGLLGKVKPEQVMCEVNSWYNGKFSSVNAHDFMRHFHWGNSVYTKQDGDRMLARGKYTRQAVMMRGKPPPPPPAAKVTPMPTMYEAVTKEVRASLSPTPPAAPPPRTPGPRPQHIRPSVSTHESLADHRKHRVDKILVKGGRLGVISSAYLQEQDARGQGRTRKGAGATQQAKLPDFKEPTKPSTTTLKNLQACIMTSFTVQKAASEASDVNLQTNRDVMVISTPAPEPTPEPQGSGPQVQAPHHEACHHDASSDADADEDFRASDDGYDGCQWVRYEPGRMQDKRTMTAQRAKLERWQEQMRISHDGRLASAFAAPAHSSHDATLPSVHKPHRRFGF